MDAATRKPWRSALLWLALVAVVASVAVVILSPTVQGWVKGVAEWAEGIMRDHPVAGGVVFFLLSALSALLAFASSLLLVPPANEVWGKPITFLLLWAGWITGALGAYFIGYFVQPLLHRLVERQTLEKYQKIVSKRMKLWMAMLVCLAVPSEIPGYVFGGLHYPFLKFLAAISVAESIYALGVIIAGESLVEAKPGVLVTTLGILFVVAVGAGLLLRAQRKRKT